MKHRLILEFCLYLLSKKKINVWFHPFMRIKPNPSQIQPHLVRGRCARCKAREERWVEDDGSAPVPETPRWCFSPAPFPCLQ